MRRSLLLLLAVSANLASQTFVGASGGIATLSGDAAKTGSPAEAFALYKPENGPTALLFAGRHLSDWWSLQATYSWNRNSVLLSAGAAGPPARAYDVPVRTTMHTVAVEAMMYFRRRADRIRPYLSAGPGIVVIKGKPGGSPSLSGTITPPSGTFDSTAGCLRVAVGIDVRLRGGLAWRYIFAETIQSNAISRQLRPEGPRSLKNWQNLWGLAWSF